MNKKLYDNIFVHKETKDGIEVALFVSCNKSRSIIETITDRIKSISKEIIDWNTVPLNLRAQYMKKSDDNSTEWPKYFISFNRKIYFSRIYKLKWNSYFKIEITIYNLKWKDRKKLVKESIKIFSSIMKWRENSCLPRYLQGGDIINPISIYLNV